MQALLHGPLSLFIAQAILVIGVSRLIGLVARRIHQPMVVAEIVAGITLGPSLLGWIAPGVSSAVFPAASLGGLGLFSQIGLVLFMFLVGLEFDGNLLRGRGKSSVAISWASIVLPFALGALVALYLYPRLSDPSIPFTSFTLFMGVAMSITAFPVLARMLVERRLLRTKVGAVAIACAAVDDVTAWCLLAFVVSMARATSLEGAVRTTLLTFAYVVVTVFLARPLLRRLADRSQGAHGVGQNLVALTVILLFASAWATEMIGIHALFGAFILGAVIPKDHGFARVLADKLEDLVVVLLLPLFFAYSGLRTQIGLLDSPASWAMCGLLIVVACVGKFVGSSVAARLTGLSWRESSALGILMNTRGLVELVALNIGLDLGVISPKLFTMMVIMALVTTFMTSPLLEWIYPAKEIAKDLLDAAPDGASIVPLPGFRVLLCVAYERSGPAMVTLAAALVRKQSEDRLYALRLIRPADRASFVMDQQREAADPSALQPLLARARALDVAVRPMSFVSARPSEDICNVAAVKHADLVVLGFHNPLLGGGALGGTVREVMQGAAADVGVLVDRGLGEIRRVLVPYLGSAHDRAALRLGQRLAKRTGASVTVLHVTRPEGKRLGVADKMRETFREDTDQGTAEVAFKLVDDADPAAAAIRESESGYDLVIVGVGPEWGLEHRPFGLQSERLIDACPGSLLVVRQRQPAAERVASPASDLVPPAIASVPERG